MVGVLEWRSGGGGEGLRECSEASETDGVLNRSPRADVGSLTDGQRRWEWESCEAKRAEATR